MTKTCFVISPIGPKESSTRENADDVLELLIEPALRGYGFEVIRADKIARPTIISTDIIDLVQRSELCIVDLTEHNPNVFYECGRRHENGKPTILIIRAGETIPFDLAGIRTLHYDLSTAKSASKSVNEIREFVEEFETKGAFELESSGISLSSIAATLSRIERNIDKISTSNEIAPVIKGPNKITRNELLTTHPTQAFKRALDAGDLESAKFVLPRVKQYGGLGQYFSALAFLSAALDEGAMSTLLNETKILIESSANESDTKVNHDEALTTAIAGITDFYLNSYQFLVGYDLMVEISESIRSSGNFSKKLLAYTLNRAQMLGYHCFDREDRKSQLILLRTAKEATTLEPSDESYWYNLSMIQENLEDFDGAVESIDNFLKNADELEDHHRAHVLEIYANAGLVEEGKVKVQEFARLS